MWKSLRIGALLALVALGALKLAQYTAAQSAADRFASALGPNLRLGYTGVGGALDGRVFLEQPRLEVLTGPARGAVIRASRATVESNGLFWLLGRVIKGETRAPEQLDLHLEGTSLAHDGLEHFGEEGWFGTTSLAPFESLACGTTTVFTARDFARMGLAARQHDDDIRYRYDAAARDLRIDLVATSAPFATITTHVELSQFDPSAWFGNAQAQKAQKIEQFSLAYADGGYLAKRNRFCAQLAGVDVGTYANQHFAAVNAFLAARGITPGDEVEQLYRKLVREGGSAELSSLPEAAFVPADFASYPPEDLLRQLNVTLRRDTAPPILLRLSFAAPEETLIADTAATVTETPTAQPAETESTPPAVTAELPETVAPEVIAHEATKTESLPLLSTAYAASVPIQTPRVDLPLSPPSEVLAVATPEPAPSLAPSIGTSPRVDPRNAIEAIPPSAPPPPPGSTAALVWRGPTIERLPEKSGAVSAYVIIPATSLGGYVGSRVQLMTAGGKLVEGRVAAIDASDVVMSIKRDGGLAEVRIPRAGIREARVRRAAVP